MMDSIIGGFLVGGLIYWLVLSNFFVILEFPYNAIVFWTLFGITMAYRDGMLAAMDGAEPYLRAQYTNPDVFDLATKLLDLREYLRERSGKARD